MVADATINGSETGTSFRQAIGFQEAGFNIHDTMIWVKDGGGAFGGDNKYMQNTEYMFVFSKGKPKSVNLIRDHKNQGAGRWSVKSDRRDADGEFHRRVAVKCREYSKRNNWWYYPRVAGYGNHPAAFQEQLAHDHIISWSNPGDLVMDPFMGSGTTAKMAYLDKRNFIGFEISAEYCQLAEKRLRETAVQRACREI